MNNDNKKYIEGIYSTLKMNVPSFSKSKDEFIKEMSNKQAYRKGIYDIFKMNAPGFGKNEYEFFSAMGLNTAEDDSLASRNSSLDSIIKSPRYPADMREKAETLKASDTTASLESVNPDEMTKLRENKENIDKEDSFNMTEYWKGIPKMFAEGVSGALSEAANAGLYGISKFSGNKEGEFNLPFNYKYYAREPNVEDFINAVKGKNYDKNLLQEVISDPVTYVPMGIVEGGLAKAATGLVKLAPNTAKAVNIVTKAAPKNTIGKGIIEGTRGLGSAALQGAETSALEQALNRDEMNSEEFNNDAEFLTYLNAGGKALGFGGKKILSNVLGGTDSKIVDDFAKFDAPTVSSRDMVASGINTLKDAAKATPGLKNIRTVKEMSNDRSYFDSFLPDVEEPPIAHLIPFINKGSSVSVSPKATIINIQNKLNKYGDKYQSVINDLTKLNSMDLSLNKVLETLEENTIRNAKASSNPKDAEVVLKIINDERKNASNYLASKVSPEDVAAAKDLDKTILERRLKPDPNKPQDMPFGKVFSERKRADKLADFAKKSNKGNKADLKKQFYRDYRSGIEGEVTRKLNEGEVFADFLKKFPSLEKSTMYSPEMDAYINNLKVSDELKLKMKEAVAKGTIPSQTSKKKAQYGTLKDKFAKSVGFRDAMEKRYSKPSSESVSLFQALAPGQYTIGSQLYKMPQRVKEVTPFYLNLGDEGDEEPPFYFE